MDIQRLKDLGFPDAEIVGEKAGKTVVRMYTEEHGWTYAKIDPADDTALDAFAEQVNPAAVASMKAGK